MTLEKTLNEIFENRTLVKMIAGNRRKKSLEYTKVTLKPVVIKNEYQYQAEYSYDKKVTHLNIPADEILSFALSLLDDFKQLNIFTTSSEVQVLASKADNPRVTVRKTEAKSAELSHNRDKNYLIAEGTPCDFLVKLGVMNKDGTVKPKHYHKFRQINRFLEIVEDVYPALPTDRTIRIIDFGCGKSYLTFALYYYLHIIKERNVSIVGLDLKKRRNRFL